MPIQCGFEAETVWPIPEDYQSSETAWNEDMSWAEMSERIEETYGERFLARILQTFRDWVLENKLDDVLDYIVQGIVDQRSNSDAWKREYISSLDEDYIADYLGYESPNDDLIWNALDDQDSKIYSDFIEYLTYDTRGDDKFYDMAYEQVFTDYTVEDWMMEEFGDWERFMYYNDIELESSSSAYDLSNVAELIEQWATESKSISDRAVPGSYHQGKSVDNTYWRVEDDTSITNYNPIYYVGVEIISPVYESIGDMLKEMQSLFTMLKNNDVQTNKSTGLHVTMSLSGETDVSLNKLKMAILLGDQYALSVFDRRFNYYTASQQDAIEKELANFVEKDDVSKMDFKELENILLGGIRGTKFSSINFKDVTNQFGNNLIEFRIGGGDNYHTNFEKVSKLAIRCGAVFLSGYFPELFKKDYIKTIYRLVDRVKSGKTDDQVMKESAEDTLQTILRLIKNG
jgi:hypothetical protein